MSAVHCRLPYINSLMSHGCVRSPAGFPAYLGLGETYGLPSVRKSYLSDHFASCKSLYHRDLLGHFGCVNAVEFSNNGGEFIVSGGDDRRVMVWNVEKCVYGNATPIILKGEHRSNIFCAVFDNNNSHIFSAGNDNQALLHDLATQEKIGMYYHDDPVYGLSVHPEDNNVFLTACDDGNVLLWDARTTSGSSECIAHYTSAFHAAVFNPVDPHLIATANSRSGVQLWDIRVPKNCLQQFSNAMPQLCAMGLKWNMTGHVLTALRRRLPPVLYHISRPSAIAEFHHPGYSNVCTMKSNCFAGSKDQYVVSGSDDFNVYIWEVPPDWADHDQQVTVGRAFLVLHGHRSIVNQVRFNPATHMLISAGVEKVVKVWSPFLVPGGQDSSKEGSASRRRQLYSHSDYLGLVRSRGLSIPYEHARESTEEDPCMLAFFDSLIDREKNDSLSDSHESIGDDFNLSFILQAGSNESSDSESVGISVNRLREILYQPSQDSPFGREDGGVLRRLRRLTHSAAIRDLLHAAVDTTSSSSSSDEEGRRVQMALPDVPRDEANERHNVENLQVRFRRRQASRNRNYRRRCRTQVETSTSGSSEVISDSSSSSGEDEPVLSTHSTELRNSPYRNDDNSSSSSSTEGSEHWIYDSTPQRMLIRKKKKLSQERGESSLNGLQGHENVVGDDHESRESHLTDSSSSCSTSLCSERASTCTCSASIDRDSSCGCEAHNGSLSQVQADSVSRNCVDTDSNDKNCVSTPEGCNKNRLLSNGLTGLSNHVPLLPENKHGPGGEGQAVGDASAQTESSDH